MQLTQTRSVWAGVLLLVAPALSAQTQLRTNLVTEARSSDNFYFQEDDERSAVGLAVRPSLSVDRQGINTSVGADVFAEVAGFNTRNEDQYLDFGGLLRGSARLGLNQLELTGGFTRGHDQLGTARTEGTVNDDRELDLWEDTVINLGWERNAQVRGSIFTEVNVTALDRRYTTNREFTGFLDRGSLQASALAGWNITAKTGVFLNTFYSDVDFDNESPNVVRSGSTMGALIGLRWKASAKTSGDIRVGAASREPDGSGQDDFTTEYYQLRFDWEPTQRDTVNVGAEKTLDGSFLLNTVFFNSDRVNASWVHNWSPTFSSRLYGRYELRELVGASQEDDLFGGGLRLDLALDYAFGVYADIGHRARESTRNGFDFEQNYITLGLSAVLN